MPKSSLLSFLGIAKESTFGTAVPPTAFIPVGNVTPKDSVTLLDDKGWRGSMVETYGKVAGPITGSIDFDGDVFPDTIGWMVTGILGDITTTGASAPFTHAVAALNSGTGQPPSYTLTDTYSVATRAYAGAKFSELSFKLSADGLFTYSAKATTFGSATATLPTASFTGVPVQPGWLGVVQIAGVTSASVLDAEVTIKRPVTVVNTVDGTQAPTNLWSGPITVDGKMTVIMEDDTQLTNYLTQVQPSIDINFAQGAGAAATQVKLHMSKVAYSAADISRGKDFVEIPITFEALANSTDIGTSAGFSPIKVTVQNAITSGTYK
jgi:hypothetical protein